MILILSYIHMYIYMYNNFIIDISNLCFDFVYYYRLDVKAQKIDRGYPRYTDAVFGGVPNDAHEVFQYKGKYLCQSQILI